MRATFHVRISRTTGSEDVQKRLEGRYRGMMSTTSASGCDLAHRIPWVMDTGNRDVP
jgi:hypothetical protein